MDVFDLSAILRLDSSQYEQGLSAAENKASGFGKVMGTAAKIGVAAWGAASAAVGVFAKDSVQTGMQFDKAMAQVGATMLKTTDEMEKEVGSVSTAYGDFSGNLREFAMFLGSETAFSATQAAEALNFMALAGYSTQESMEMLPNVLSLAAAGNMDLARASDMVTDTQTAFGLSAERTSLLVDEMAKAASTGNTSVEQLGDAFLVVGGLAQELNGGFVKTKEGAYIAVDGIQEMEIAMTAMANAGIKGSEAGTHMRNVIMKLSNPTEKGAKLMEDLGLNIFDTEGNMRSLNDIFSDLRVSMETMTQEEKINAISELFNARDLASAEALLNAVSQDWDEIGESILDAKGSAAEMANIQLDNLPGDITLFQSALESAKIVLSNQLTPSLREFVQFGTESVQTLTNAFKEGGLSGAMEALGGVVTDGLNLFMSALPQFVSAGGQLLLAIGTGIANSLPALFSTGMEIIGAITTSISENLPNLIPVAMEALVSFSAGLRENVGSLVDAGLGMIMAIADGLIQNIPVFIETIPTIVTNIAGIINDNAPKLLATGITIIGNLVMGIISAVPTLIAEFPNILMSIASVITAFNWVGLGSSIITFIGNGVRSLASSLPTLLKNIGDNAWNFLRNVNWAGLGQSIIQFIVNGVQSLFTAIPNALMSIGQSAMTAFTNINWLSVGVNIVSGIASGIANAAHLVVSAITNIASNAFNGILSFFGIKSPSRLMRDKVGKMIPAGMALGIKDNTPMVVEAIEDMDNDAFDTVDDIGYDTDTVVKRIDDGEGRPDSRVADLLQKLIDAIEYMDEGLYEKMSSAFGDISLELNGREFGRLVNNVRTS